MGFSLNSKKIVPEAISYMYTISGKNRKFGVWIYFWIAVSGTFFVHLLDLHLGPSPSLYKSSILFEICQSRCVDTSRGHGVVAY